MNPLITHVKWTDDEYDNTYKYIANGVIPNYLPARLERFMNRSRLLRIEGNKIKLGNKELVPESRVNDVLTKLYRDPSTSVNSRDRFYGAVADRYVGISRRRVQEFLSNQESYQLHLAPPHKKIVKPIVTHRANQHHQVDLIDMSKGNYPFWNNNYTRVLTMIDLFSKYAWAYPLKRGTGAEVARALKNHYKDNPKPTILQTDNGPEFQTEVDALLKELGIKHVKSLAYKPTSQGAIERFNRTLKQRLYHWMSIYGTKTWVDLLPKVLEGYNNSVHSTTHKKPIEVYNSNDNVLRKDVQRRIEKQAAKVKSTPELEELKRGQTVRLSNYTNPNDRKRKTFKKKYLPNWSKEIYTVYMVSKNGQYRLKDKNGVVLSNVYHRHDLLPINVDKLVTVREQRPPRYDEEPLMDDIIRERAEDRRAGRLIVPQRVPEHTALEERDAQRDEISAKQQRRLPANLKKPIEKRISVYWPRYEKWYNGKVISYSTGRQEYVIRYDEPDTTGNYDIWEKLHGLGKVRWKYL
ncbi:MAG TPA: DDE-type integrase/transposase/recombinase [Candidatus Dojkabacteria bacterium]|nr:DDE-type integrase/transposase/recombinase [Candidatus Dojkabacteria bacterium]